MKKALSSALALGLVAGVASTAAAFDSFKVSGFYTVQGYYVSNTANLTTNSAQPWNDNQASSAWYEHNFSLFPDLQVNDKVHMKAEVRLADEDVWGGSDRTDPDVNATNSGRTADIHKLYMEYDSPVGKTRIGRTPGGAWKTPFVDSAGNANRIMWWPNMLPKPFNALVFVQKTTEADGPNTTAADQDSDYYEVDLGYKEGMVDATIAYAYTDNQTTNVATDNTSNKIKGHAKVTMNNMYVETEFDYNFGELETDTVGDADLDVENFAFMIDAGTSMANLNLGLMYWYLSGDDDADNDQTAYTGLGGNDFSPLLVSYHDGLGILNPESIAGLSPNSYDFGLAPAGVNANRYGVAGATANTAATGGAVRIAGQHGVALHAAYTVSDKLAVTSALGAIWAAEELSGWDDELGWEFDLGASYKLLDNLTYSVNFGYFDTGDFFVGYNPAGTSTIQTEDVYVLHNSLNMTF